jgi:hypothetical protein
VKTSSTVTDYASPAELAQAVAELRAHTKTLAADAKRARKAAREADPLFDFKPRSRNGRAAARTVRKLRTPDVLEVTDRVIWVSGQHEFTVQAADVLASPGGRLDHWAIAHGLDVDELGDNCPAFRSIVARWRAALDNAGETITPSRDAAKRAQLDEKVRQLDARLARIQQARRG